VFTAASHFALWQDPEAFNRALVEFLTAPDVVEPMAISPSTGRSDAARLP
jgi:hypothetical protein